MDISLAEHDGTGGIRISWICRLAVLVASLLVCGASVQASNVLILTENYPPFSHHDDTGNIVGSSTEAVRKVMDHAGLAYTIRIVPWGRAMSLARSRDNVLIFSILRSRHREAGFHWLVPLAKVDLHFYGRMNDTRTLELGALRQGLFTAVCTKGAASCRTFQELGMPEKSVLRNAETKKGEARLVASGRADLFVAHERLIRELGRKDPRLDGRFRKMMQFPSPGWLYLAAGKKLKPEIRDRVVHSFHTLRDNGQLPDGPE